MGLAANQGKWTSGLEIECIVARCDGQGTRAEQQGEGGGVGSVFWGEQAGGTADARSRKGFVFGE